MFTNAGSSLALFLFLKIEGENKSLNKAIDCGNFQINDNLLINSLFYCFVRNKFVYWLSHKKKLFE